MSKDREDREGQDEELEPLDKFFAPIEDVDWPEEAEGASKPGGPVSSAAVPEEADTPSTAMQLADVRMYAQKESRRLADPLRAFDREALEQHH